MDQGDTQSALRATLEQRLQTIRADRDRQQQRVDKEAARLAELQADIDATERVLRAVLGAESKSSPTPSSRGAGSANVADFVRDFVGAATQQFGASDIEKAMADAAMTGTRNAVVTALSRLAKSGEIVTVRRGSPSNEALYAPRIASPSRQAPPLRQAPRPMPAAPPPPNVPPPPSSAVRPSVDTTFLRGGPIEIE